MRQGAPRLGGLGLGGVGATSTPSTPPRSPSQASMPTSPPGSTSPQKIKRKPSPQTDQDVFQSDPPHRPTPVFALPPAPALPQRPSGTPNERPFLSPEIVKPTFRREAFALDRPVPDSGLGSQVAPVATAPDSPVPMDSPTSLDHFTSSVVADDASPELSHLRWFPPDKSLVSASLARGAEAQEVSTFSIVGSLSLIVQTCRSVLSARPRPTTSRTSRTRLRRALDSARPSPPGTERPSRRPGTFPTLNSLRRTIPTPS